MTRTKLRAAIVEAQRFIDRAKYLDYLLDRHPRDAREPATAASPAARSRAARRASMDLTRALAELRRRL